MMLPARLAGRDLRDHAPGGGLADEKRALEVHPQHAVEVGFRQREEIGAVNDAGIVDQDVDAAERAAGFRDHVLGRLRIADIGVDELGLAEGARRRLAGFGIDVGDGDARALGDVAPGNRVADAVRPAGHDRDLVLEPHAALRIRGKRSTRRLVSAARTAGR